MTNCRIDKQLLKEQGTCHSISSSCMAMQRRKVRQQRPALLAVQLMQATATRPLAQAQGRAQLAVAAMRPATAQAAQGRAAVVVKGAMAMAQTEAIRAAVVMQLQQTGKAISSNRTAMGTSSRMLKQGRCLCRVLGLLPTMAMCGTCRSGCLQHRWPCLPRQWATIPCSMQDRPTQQVWHQSCRCVL